jgi:hypothetical protein
MNTNALKKFAQEARRKLIEQVGSKLEYVLHTDTPELREKADQINKLKEAIQSTSKEQVIDKVTYTWFNRFMALRFMDANDYQPIGIRVLTPKDGYTLPELLDEAKQGNIPEELKVKNQRIYDLLDGKIPSTNAQNEAYKELLIGACNHLNKVLPFLFERINDYTELLLPDDLTSELSIVQDIRDGMSIEDCAEVEVIGWLYQFYISEKNEELISSKKVYKKEDLAPASQLFTPKWIVQYMVDNTLGQVWSEINPNTKVTSDLDFYIKPDYVEQLEKREKKSIEEIKFFEPCAGSGHILAYAFDVFYKIYEEEGYNPTEIPELIISKNLFGVDIDPRAAQIASFVLLMKGRQKNRRFLRTVETKSLQPNISYYQDFEFDDKFKNATALGSLIKIEPSELNNLQIDKGSLFGERQEELKKLYQLLGQRYDVVVTNPPYIKAARMEPTLREYVESQYPDTKADLYTTFMVRCIDLTNENGYTGYMTPFVWMFILSFQPLRELLIKDVLISTFIQLEYSGFDGATVPICTFTLSKKKLSEAKGTYIRLTDFVGPKIQGPKALEAIKQPESKWRYNISQLDFLRIEGSPIAYWIRENDIEVFEKSQRLGDVDEAKSGVMTGNDLFFLRFWSEVSTSKIGFGYNNINEVDYSKHSYLPLNKEEGFRKWSGRYKMIFKLLENDINFKLIPKLNYRLRDKELYFQEGISWGNVTSGATSYRYQNKGLVFADKAPMIFTDKKFLVAILNTKIAKYYREILNPTISFTIGDLHRIPIPHDQNALKTIDDIVLKCLSISDIEWSSNELSYHFNKSELIRLKGQDLEETYGIYQQYWKNKFFQLHKNEEELNSQFIEIYDLQEELTPIVTLEDITILKEETVIKKGRLTFKQNEVFAQFMSYAVGCMFGRYSLDKEGLILANQGETLEDYLEKVGLTENKVSFTPDDDNIIPVLDDEWFEDDITGRFYAFLKASFGKGNFDKNLAFVEECLGKDIRKYFVKDFYNDHIKRYKKRPIYWMFSSPKGAFNVLIYMHRYTPDTLSKILNSYLIQYREKLNTHLEHLDHLTVSGTSAEQTRAIKEKEKLKLVLLELTEYERDILYPLATERINIDLDEGVLVNYNKFGKAIKEIKGLNDKVTKKKVSGFDWIDATTIR